MYDSSLEAPAFTPPLLQTAGVEDEQEKANGLI